MGAERRLRDAQHEPVVEGPAPPWELGLARRLHGVLEALAHCKVLQTFTPLW